MEADKCKIDAWLHVGGRMSMSLNEKKKSVDMMQKQKYPVGDVEDFIKYVEVKNVESQTEA